MIVVIMGPSGSGKTTVGSLLAKELRWRFCDADDLHSPENVRKMSSGIPLEEADRLPWLHKVRAVIDRHLESEQKLVLACSALRHSHRQSLGLGHPQVHFVLLEVPPALLRSRLEARTGHFMPPSLLPSQLGAFEKAEGVVVVDAALPPMEVAEAIRQRLDLSA